MPISKIQGGGDGRYSNKGSCTGVVTYLQHEDMDRVMEGLPVEPFFDSEYDKISSKEVTFMIDNNKAQLGHNDAKFYVLTIAPSKEELKAMGSTPQERANAMKNYVRNDVMNEYAKNFGREGLTGGNQLRYYAKVHHQRGDKGELNMHCHVIVSRKSIDNKLKLSPQTNHRNTKKGRVKGGFDRTIFYEKAEQSFDKRFSYERMPIQSFKYQNAMKNGNIPEIKTHIQKTVARDIQKSKQISKSKNFNKGKGLEL